MNDWSQNNSAINMLITKLPIKKYTYLSKAFFSISFLNAKEYKEKIIIIVPNPIIPTELNFEVSSINVKEKNFKNISIIATMIASIIS